MPGRIWIPEVSIKPRTERSTPVATSQNLQGNPGIRAEDLEERLEILKGEYEAAETSEGFFSPFAVLSLDVRVVEKKTWRTKRGMVRTPSGATHFALYPLIFVHASILGYIITLPHAAQHARSHCTSRPLKSQE